MNGSPQPAVSGVVLERREDAIVVLTLNRPDRLNAIHTELAEALLASLRRAAADDAVRCVVLTGAGRAFCSGGDLKLLAEVRQRNAPEELRRLLEAGHALIAEICAMPKPVVAAVNGPAAGAGMNLALACDIRIAADSASFGENFARVGLFPDFGGTFLLPRLVGPARAAELFYTGEMISAEEAARIGIVNRVVPAARLDEEVRALAARLAAAPPLAVRSVKQVLFGRELEALRQAMEFEAGQQVACFGSADAMEGFTAFFEKRTPVFRGR
jgi:2-(1,2-epoxy-1,2-dihydrophenyl)acetyl-CoA isomerase